MPARRPASRTSKTKEGSRRPSRAATRQRRKSRGAPGLEEARRCRVAAIRGPQPVPPRRETWSWTALAQAAVSRYRLGELPIRASRETRHLARSGVRRLASRMSRRGPSMACALAVTLSRGTDFHRACAGTSWKMVSYTAAMKLLPPYSDGTQRPSASRIGANRVGLPLHSLNSSGRRRRPCTRCTGVPALSTAMFGRGSAAGGLGIDMTSAAVSLPSHRRAAAPLRAPRRGIESIPGFGPAQPAVPERATRDLPAGRRRGKLVKDLLDDGARVAVLELKGREQIAPAVPHGEDPSFALPARGRFARVLRVEARCGADFMCRPRRHFLEVGRSQQGVVELELRVDRAARRVREHAANQQLDVVLGELPPVCRDHGCEPGDKVLYQSGELGLSRHQERPIGRFGLGVGDSLAKRGGKGADVVGSQGEADERRGRPEHGLRLVA